MGKQTPRYRHMMYAQQMRHLPPGINTKEDLARHIEADLRPEQYAIIVHDQEVDEQGQPKEADIHAMMSFKNPRSLASVAKKLGDKPQYIQKWDGEANNGYAYLIHATTKARKGGKHQYDPSDVLANFDYGALLTKIALDVAQVRAERDAKPTALLDALYAGVTTKKEIERQLPGSVYARYHRQIEDADAKRLQNEAEKWRKEMSEKNAKITVLWIFGAAGTGKTSLAREYAEKKGQPYYITGSSRDIFQSYNGEHTIIMDELRPKVIEYADLLRITDPHGIDTQVMAPARYSDKPLACELIIITSPYGPHDFYWEMFRSGAVDQDGFDQLQRRIALTILMDSNSIYAINYDAAQKQYLLIPNSTRPNPYSQAARAASAVDPIDIYNSMFIRS